MTNDGIWGLLTLLLILYFFFEARNHEKNLKQIPLRIHVNGTRGKSSVTRLIAAGLRESSMRVVGKTTGTEAKLILPDGEEQRLVRRGLPNIKELIGFVKMARAHGADVLVAECMALRPELQQFAEHRLIQSHIGVITNIRADHEDVMGQGLISIAGAFAGAMPQDGVLVTTPEAKTTLLSLPLRQTQTKILAVSGQSVSSRVLAEFPYEVVPDNVAIALKVCELAGVDQATALAGMYKARPDAGNLTVRTMSLPEKKVTVINALAANDPESTLWLWHRYAACRSGCTVVLLNCRSDRRYRTNQLCRALAAVHQGRYIIAGDRDFARRQLIAAGISPSAVIKLPSGWKDGDVSSLIWDMPDHALIFAAGNVQGMSKLMAGEWI